MLFEGQSISYKSVNHHQMLLNFCQLKKKDMYLLSGSFGKMTYDVISLILDNKGSSDIAF